jgi:hypothetical protein
VTPAERDAWAAGFLAAARLFSGQRPEYEKLRDAFLASKSE